MLYTVANMKCTPSVLECKASKGLNLYPNIRYLKVFWIKRHANLLDFGAKFVNKSIAVGQSSKKKRKDMSISLVLVRPLKSKQLIN